MNARAPAIHRQRKRILPAVDAAYTLGRFSTEARCMDELDVKDLGRFASHVYRVEYLPSGEVMQRRLSPVRWPIFAKGIEVDEASYLADRTTGTLYDPLSGASLTSDALRIIAEDL